MTLNTQRPENKVKSTSRDEIKSFRGTRFEQSECPYIAYALKKCVCRMYNELHFKGGVGGTNLRT